MIDKNPFAHATSHFISSFLNLGKSEEHAHVHILVLHPLPPNSSASISCLQSFVAEVLSFGTSKRTARYVGR